MIILIYITKLILILEKSLRIRKKEKKNWADLAKLSVL